MRSRHCDRPIWPKVRPAPDAKRISHGDANSPRSSDSMTTATQFRADRRRRRDSAHETLSPGSSSRASSVCSASISSARKRAPPRSSRACMCTNSCTTAAICSASPATDSVSGPAGSGGLFPGRHALAPPRDGAWSLRPRLGAASVEDQKDDNRIFVVAGNDRRLRRRPAFVRFVESGGRTRGRPGNRIRKRDGRSESQGRA